MNKKQKALIAEAVPYKEGIPLSSVLVIPSGRLYKGFFTSKDWDHIILIGEDAQNDTVYYLNPKAETDVFFLIRCNVASIDIPHRFGGAIRVSFRTPVVIPYLDPDISSVTPVEIPDFRSAMSEDEWDENGEYHREGLDVPKEK